MMQKEYYERLDATGIKSWDEFLHFRSQTSKETYFIAVEFSNQKSAEKYFRYLKGILPIIDERHPKVEGCTVTLSNNEFYFFQISWMQENGELHPGFLGDQYLLKTLRADQYDFSLAFKWGLIIGENGKRYHNLRPVQRRDFTLSPRREVTSRLEKKPDHTMEEKLGYSQIQSCTYIDAELLVDPFGFSKGRKEKLYGLLTHINDALISRSLLNDCGTMARPFDFANRESAIAERNPSYPRDKFGLFVEHNLQMRRKAKGTNEVLARLRFDPYRTLVVIVADTLESRCLAYQFAEELLLEFRKYAQRCGIKLNPNYKIPIIFYRPLNWLGNRPELLFYSLAMRKKDCEECCKIQKDTGLRNDKFQNKDYEYLLGLPKITDDILLGQTKKGNLLALEILRNGYVRMLFRLLRPVVNHNDNTLCNTLFDQLLRRGKINKNDFIIGDLILIEEFSLAAKIIVDTQSDKGELKFREYDESRDVYVVKSLEDYLLLKGNPRHIEFMGLEKMLRKAVEQKKWVTIRLCVKEFPAISKAFLGELLVGACLQQNPAEVDFLLKKGADVTVVVNQKTAMECAKELQDETILGLLGPYFKEALDVTERQIFNC